MPLSTSVHGSHAVDICQVSTEDKVSYFPSYLGEKQYLYVLFPNPYTEACIMLEHL